MSGVQYIAKCKKVGYKVVYVYLHLQKNYIIYIMYLYA